uniref:Uncharacterized protein n=1 Tax=Leersia perrieri TaxID=77586 RepID=A0A0D9UYD5_9ORYZ
MRQRPEPPNDAALVLVIRVRIAIGVVRVGFLLLAALPRRLRPPPAVLGVAAAPHSHRARLAVPVAVAPEDEAQKGGELPPTADGSLLLLLRDGDRGGDCQIRLRRRLHRRLGQHKEFLRGGFAVDGGIGHREVGGAARRRWGDEEEADGGGNGEGGACGGHACLGRIV